MPAADQVGDHAGPAGLVEGADRGAVVAVEVLAEDQVVVPGRIGLHDLGPAEAGPPAVRAAGEDRDQPVRQVGGDLVQGQLLAGPGRVLDREVVAEEPVVPLQDADHQVVQREPDRAAPVGVPAEHGRGGLGRLVVDARRDALDLELVGMVAVIGGQGPQAVRGQELALVEQLGEQPLQPVRPAQAEQQPLLAGLAAQQASLAELVPVAQVVPVQEVREPLADRKRSPQVILGDDRGRQGGDDAHHRPDLHRHGLPARRLEPVVVKPVGVVPQPEPVQRLA